MIVSKKTRNYVVKSQNLIVFVVLVNDRVYECNRASDYTALFGDFREANKHKNCRSPGLSVQVTRWLVLSPCLLTGEANDELQSW